MTTNQKQFEFAIKVARIVLFAKECELSLRLWECWRSKDRQRQMVARHLSSTMNSKHLLGLAQDFDLFRDGKPVYDSADPDWLLLGEYAESLGLRWGGRWGDARHFEYKD